MTDRELATVLKCIDYAPDEDLREAAAMIAHQARSDSISLKLLRKQKSESRGNGKTGGKIQLSEKEISILSEKMKSIIAVGDRIVSYRVTNGVYQARYRRCGLNINVASKDFNVMVKKLIAALQDADRLMRDVDKASEPKCPLFKDFAEQWIELKEITTKPRTMMTYKSQVNSLFIPAFGDRRLDQITRNDVQTFLNDMMKTNKVSSVRNLQTRLKDMFNLAEEDYGIKSPVAKTVLPHFEVTKGTALTKAEEKRLVDHCAEHRDSGACAAILILLYTGMRVGELKSVTCEDGFVCCVSEKTRMGYSEEIRKIPYTPMLRRVLSFIDFEKAKTTSDTRILKELRLVFPERHTHELRYTFITRAKECGINPEVVMIWDGHKEDHECRSSKVDRGYTTYSDEYFLAEAQKFDYEL